MSNLSSIPVMGCHCDCGFWVSSNYPRGMEGQQRQFYEMLKQQGWEIGDGKSDEWEADDDGLWWAKCPMCRLALIKFPGGAAGLRFLDDTSVADILASVLRIESLLEGLVERWKQPILIINASVYEQDPQRVAEDLEAILGQRFEGETANG